MSLDDVLNMSQLEVKGWFAYLKVKQEKEKRNGQVQRHTRTKRQK